MDADRGTPNSLDRLRTESSRWGGMQEASSLIRTGWKVRKNPAAGKLFLSTTLSTQFRNLIDAFRKSMDTH